MTGMEELDLSHELRWLEQDGEYLACVDEVGCIHLVRGTDITGLVILGSRAPCGYVYKIEMALASFYTDELLIAQKG